MNREWTDYADTEEDGIKIISLIEENQKLKQLLDLAIGDEGLGFYSDKSNWLDTAYYTDAINSSDLSASGPINAVGGKRARVTRERILRESMIVIITDTSLLVRFS